MQINEIIRAWQDEDFRECLNEQQRASLPENPVGVALSDEELQDVVGGSWDPTVVTTLSDSRDTHLF